jgi:hypothetical protein
VTQLSGFGPRQEREAIVASGGPKSAGSVELGRSASPRNLQAVGKLPSDAIMMIREMKALRYLLFAVACAADALIAVTTLMLKGATDFVVSIWATCAVFLVCGFVGRIVLSRRKGLAALAWADALKPTRLGAAIVIGVLVLYIAVLLFALTAKPTA